MSKLLAYAGAAAAAHAWLRERFVCKSDVIYIFRDRIDKFADSIRASGLTILEGNMSFVN